MSECRACLTEQEAPVGGSIAEAWLLGFLRGCLAHAENDHSLRLCAEHARFVSYVLKHAYQEIAPPDVEVVS